jgi:hypothetical protein
MTHPMPDPDPSARLFLARRTLSLLQTWGLGASDIASILSLPAGGLGRFGTREPFPDDPRIARRVDYLLRIDESLHTFFPRNPEMRTLWVKRGDRRFGKRAPIAVMTEDGESGMIRVLSHLDCTFAWDLTGSRSEYRDA